MRRKTAIKKLQKLLHINDPTTKEEMYKVNREIFFPLLEQYKVTRIEVHCSWYEDEDQVDIYIYQGEKHAQFPNKKVSYYQAQGIFKNDKWQEEIVKQTSALGYALQHFAMELYYSEKKSGNRVVYRSKDLAA